VKSLNDYFWESVNNGLTQRKLIREFIFSAEQNNVPISWLHEHIPVFTESEYFTSKRGQTQRMYLIRLRKWVRWVYEEEELSVPTSLYMQYELETEEEKEEVVEEKKEEQSYEYIVPMAEEPINDEYADFLRRYEEVSQ